MTEFIITLSIAVLLTYLLTVSITVHLDDLLAVLLTYSSKSFVNE